MMKTPYIVFVLICLLTLGGCSYKPLYGSDSQSRGVVGDLASISIPEADTRLGQIIRNDLLSSMHPAGTSADDRYRLDLKITQSKSDIINKSQPNNTRQSALVSVTFSLMEGANEVYSGKTFSQVSYDVVRQPFADTQAENNALERVAHELSGDIRTRLAAYFTTH